MATTAFLKGFEFHPSEWQEYAHTQADTEAAGGVHVTLIALGEDAGCRLELCSWAPGSECLANAAGSDSTAATTDTCGIYSSQQSVFSCHSLLQSSDKESVLVGAGRCWLKVLRGELDEAEYVVPAGSGSSAGSGASVVVRRARLSQGSVTYFHDDTPLTLDGPAAERTTVSVPTRRCMLTHPASRGAPTDDRSSYTFALRLVCP